MTSHSQVTVPPTEDTACVMTINTECNPRCGGYETSTGPRPADEAPFSSTILKALSDEWPTGTDDFCHAAEVEFGDDADCQGKFKFGAKPDMSVPADETRAGATPDTDGGALVHRSAREVSIGGNGRLLYASEYTGGEILSDGGRVIDDGTDPEGNLEGTLGIPTEEESTVVLSDSISSSCSAKVVGE
ncbi:hypothetical protein HDU93_003385 [Gonapodya sp. JEL0774]|nr:hypothetical protein HDU93_003385 [Gonapodya sp. JEL0774]